MIEKTNLLGGNRSRSPYKRAILNAFGISAILVTEIRKKKHSNTYKLPLHQLNIESIKETLHNSSAFILAYTLIDFEFSILNCND